MYIMTYIYIILYNTTRDIYIYICHIILYMYICIVVPHGAP